jgi:hypothetical protein
VEGLTFFGAYFGSTISWAGRRYLLLRDGTLQPTSSETRPEKDEPAVIVRK